MEQAPNEDDLLQLRVSLTEATQSLLSHLEEPQEAFKLKFVKIQYASRLLSTALLRAAPHVSMELSEAYEHEGNMLPTSTAFLCSAVLEFRRRRGIHF